MKAKDLAAVLIRLTLPLAPTLLTGIELFMKYISRPFPSFLESRTGANVAEKVDAAALYDFAPSASRSAFVSDRPVVAIETLVGVPVRIFPQIFFRFFFLSFFKNANQFFFCFLFLFYYYYYFLLKKERKEGENKETR